MAQIDKTFRIGTPMRKVSWTRRFAAGWGGGGGRALAVGSVGGPSTGIHRRFEREMGPDARNGSETAVCLTGKRGAKLLGSTFQVT